MVSVGQLDSLWAYEMIFICTASRIIIAARKQWAWIICDTRCECECLCVLPSDEIHETLYRPNIYDSISPTAEKNAIVVYFPSSFATNEILYVVPCIFTIALIISYSYYDFMFSLHLFIAIYAWGRLKSIS